MLRRSCPLLLLALSLPCAATGQDDARDLVTKTDGRTLAGRVVDPFATAEVLLLQQGKRVRVPRAEIAGLDLVGDRVREFCERRVALRDQPRAQWYLVEWAQSRGLPGLARAQAMALVLADDALEAPHEFLGHRKGAKGWLWEIDGRFVPRETFEASLAKQPFEIVGERFVVRCSADLLANVHALLDLERLGVEWFRAFGTALQPAEVLAPMRVVVHRSGEAFPKWGFRPLPYYVPPPHGDLAHTFFLGLSPERPQKLFFVGTQALLYRTLIGEADRTNDRDRVCPWLEVGLGMWLENTLQGPAGFAAPQPRKAQDLLALQALERTYRLTHLLHVPMYSGFYLMDDTATAVNWSAAAMFVAWLLEPDHTPSLREPFLTFVRQALVQRKGDSSTAFDKAMGRRVEELEAPWVEWLRKQARY